MLIFKWNCCNDKNLIQVSNLQNLLQFLYLLHAFFKLGYSNISSPQDMVLNHFPKFSAKYMPPSLNLVKMQTYIL